MSDDALCPDRRSFFSGMMIAPWVWTRAEPLPREHECFDLRPSDVESAAKVLDLEFTPAERERLVKGLLELREGYRRIRAQTVPNSLAPAATFRARGWRSDWPRSGVHAIGPAPHVPPTSEEDLAFLPVHRLAPLLRARKLRSLDLTRTCLERLERLGPKLECVITLTKNLALAQAAAADREMDDGRWRGPLHGVPYGLKDLFAVRGHPTTWGATPFKDQVLEENAAVYERLRDAGAVLCAKLTLGALAQGDRWFGGKTRNPWKLTQGSSGSSAGSAAAVAAGLLPFALGTETLGSIVSPSSRCGTTGLRPTFGRVSRFGAMALSWSMDKVGPITRSVRDAALVLAAIAGRDERDDATFEAPVGFEAGRPLRSYRIGMDKSGFSGNRIDPDDARVLEVLDKLGANLVSVDLPQQIPARDLTIILTAEAAAAFDDITRDGRVRTLVGQDASDWPDTFRKARFIPAVEYIQASRLRTRLLEQWNEVMGDVDVLVSPTFRGGTLVATNLTGHPACVVPNGFRRDGTPKSITFVAPLAGEAPLLEVASAFQEATDWHLRRPDLG